MNVNSKGALRACTSCQMCAAVCPCDAITIDLNESGFYRPFVDGNKCIDCGLCTKVCYRFDEDIHITSEDKLKSMNVYSAQVKDDKLLQKVTSGGVADVLAKQLIKLGYVCIGVTYNDEHHRAENVVATSSQETNSFRGSKYIQSYTFDAFKQLVKTAKQHKYAVFGLPCHIYACHRFLTSKKIRQNCVLVDLFCHGCPSLFCWTKYEKGIKNRLNQKPFEEVQFRSKVRNWGNFYVSVKADGEKLFVSSPGNDEFYSLFFSDHVLNDACSDCKLRSTMEYTDIRLGDFWGKIYLKDTKGTSAVAIASECGQQLFESLAEKFIINKHEMKEVITYQSYGKIYHPNLELRKRMLTLLRDNDKSLKDVVKLFYSKQGMLPRAKHLLKTINWYLPFDLTRFLKKLF